MTPRLAVIDDRYINYDGHPVISVLADPDATPETIAAMRTALVAAVRDADTLRQARQLAEEFRSAPTYEALYEALPKWWELIDLLSSPAPQGEGT